MITGRTILYFLHLLAFSPAAHAATAPVLELHSESALAGKCIETLEDASQALSLEYISTSSDINWKQSSSDNPVFGYSDSIYWVRLSFHIDASQLKNDWLLELAYPHLDRVEISILKDNQLIKQFQVGDHLPFSKRQINYRNFVIPLDLEEAGQYAVYLRIKTTSSVQFPLVFRSNKNFLDKKLTELFSLGIYYGVVLVMALYNLFLYFSIRDKVYIYYVLYMLGWCGFQLSYTGLAFQYLWPNLPELVDKTIPFFQGFSGIWFVLFSIRFLKTKEHTPKLDILLRLLVLLCVSDLLFILYSTKIAIIIGVSLGFLLSGSALVSGILALSRGYRPARFYVLAFSVFLCGLSALAINAFGLFESSFVSNYSVQIGSSLEAILLSFALGDKIFIEQTIYTNSINSLNTSLKGLVESEKQSKRELEISQVKLIELNESLEHKVEEKTNQLIDRNRKALQPFLPPEVVDDILSGKITLQEKPVERSVTIMFIDLVNFTRSTEFLGPEKTGLILNQYLERLSQTIFDNQGSIDKFLGDGIMTIYGYPKATDASRQLYNAINTAWKILEDLAELNVGWSNQSLPTFQVRIGIHSGPVVIGSFGSKVRSDFTAIGPTVNIAARIEPKALPDSIFISEASAKLCSDIEMEDMGPFSLKGITEPMRLFRILSKSPAHLQPKLGRSG